MCILNLGLLKQVEYMWIAAFFFLPTLLLKALTLTTQRESRELPDADLQNFWLMQTSFRKFCFIFASVDTGCVLEPWLTREIRKASQSSGIFSQNKQTNKQAKPKPNLTEAHRQSVIVTVPEPGTEQRSGSSSSACTSAGKLQDSPSVLFHPTALWIPTFLTFLICSALEFLVLLFTFPFFYSVPAHPLFSAIPRADVIAPDTLPATSCYFMPHHILVGVICAAASWKIFMCFPLPKYCFPFLITFGLSPPWLCRWGWWRVVELNTNMRTYTFVSWWGVPRTCASEHRLFSAAAAAYKS